VKSFGRITECSPCGVHCGHNVAHCGTNRPRLNTDWGEKGKKILSVLASSFSQFTRSSDVSDWHQMPAEGPGEHAQRGFGDCGDELADGRGLHEEDENYETEPAHHHVSFITDAHEIAHDVAAVERGNGQQVENAEQQAESSQRKDDV